MRRNNNKNTIYLYSFLFLASLIFVQVILGKNIAASYLYQLLIDREWWVFLAGIMSTFPLLVSWGINKQERLQWLSTLLNRFNRIVLYCMCLIISVAFIPVLIKLGLSQGLSFITQYFKEILYQYYGGGLFLGTSFGILVWMTISRHMSSFVINKLAPRLTKRASKEGILSDIRYAELELPVIKTNYNPADYYKEGEMFFGLTEGDKPLYVSRNQWVEDNAQIIGSPGSGKGVEGCNLVAQGLMHGDAIIHIEGKNDRWAPHVLKDACEANNLPFHFIDLNSDVPQINLFRGASYKDLVELFDAGLSLAERGKDSDIYKKQMRFWSKKLAKKHDGVSSVKELFDREARDDEAFKKEARGLYLDLHELSSLEAINTSEGLDIGTVLQSGGVIYVLGHLNDQAVVRLQKLILVRCIQLIRQRDRNKSLRHTTIWLDEFRYHISAPAVQAMATLRDFNCNMILSYQSRTDVKACGGDLDPEVTLNSIQECSPIKVVYKVQDPGTRRWASEATGRVVIKQEREKIIRNKALAEQVEPEKTRVDIQRYHISPEMIQAFPERYALVFTDKATADIVTTAPYMTQKHQINIEPAYTAAKSSNPPVSTDVESMIRPPEPIKSPIEMSPPVIETAPIFADSDDNSMYAAMDEYEIQMRSNVPACDVQNDEDEYDLMSLFEKNMEEGTALSFDKETLEETE